jgi:hypothetical protein
MHCPEATLQSSVQGFNLVEYVLAQSSCGPKGQDNLAQGLPWVNFSNRMGPEGAFTARIGPRSKPCAFPPLGPLQG